VRERHDEIGVDATIEVAARRERRRRIEREDVTETMTMEK